MVSKESFKGKGGREGGRVLLERKESIDHPE